ncbi:ABC transporter permease [Gulosibacter molinativorax]|uniref:ABC transporter permease n=1 Tax=Gulosibacter molinativorax TaxID=256821 RepID=A0ABT7C5W3_9MICO|nr:ABC transporter permease [Gulosibacter molinativorax]MDJ1370597.1 ABC transporter permease [Gulosibacter molinativorax]QUY61989.1 Hypotetical protein [Gulosibacter molinativorax]
MMGTTWLLALRSLRKQPMQVIAMGLLTLLAAALINLGVVTAVDFPRGLEERFDELRTPDLEMLLVDDESAEIAEDALAGDDRVSEYQVESAPVFLGTFSFGDSEQTALMTALDVDAFRGLSRLGVVEAATEEFADGAYVPVQWRDSGGYALGDAFKVEGIGATYRFTVQGFFESPSLGSISMGNQGLALHTDAYDDFLAEQSPPMGSFISAMTHDPADAEAVLADVSEEILAALPANTQLPFSGSTLDTMRMAATIGSNVTSAILTAFAVILAAVTALVLRYVCRNTIERDLQGIGTMKAIGVSVAQIRGSFLVTFAGVGLLAVFLGVGLSYAFMPIVENMLSTQSGILWQSSFNPLGLALAIVILVGTIVVSTLLSTRRVKRIPPVTALRGGILTHSFKRNPLPLETTRGPLLGTLGLKQLLQNPAQVVSITVIVALVTFASMFALAAVKNIANDPVGFTHLIAGDYEAVSVYPAEGIAAEDAFADDLAQMEGVRKAFPKSTANGTSEGTQIALMVTDDYDLLDLSTILEGRYPLHDNEIAIGAKASEVLDAGVGDTIPVTINSGTEDYLITGLTQSSRSLGMEGSLTTAGAVRADATFEHNTVAIYLEEGYETGPVIDDIEEQYASEVAEIIDYRANVQGQSVTYVSMAAGLSAAILGITIAVIAIILSLMVSTLLVQQRRDFGVRRAIGYTWVELAVQTALAYVPVVALGGVLGALAGFGFLDSLVSAMLSGIGLVQASLPVDVSWAIVLVLALILLAFVLVFALASRIRRISPVELVRT